MDGEAVADRLTNTCEAEQREQREAMERSDVYKRQPGTEESKEPPKKQPIKEVLQDKADEKKAQRTAPAQTKHRQQDMEL